MTYNDKMSAQNPKPPLSSDRTDVLTAKERHFKLEYDDY